MPSPRFTLTATLESITGQPAGSTPNPARLQVMLCNYGLYLPAIPGDNNQTELFKEYRSTGQQLSIPLWGNDDISPAGTYYAITILDGRGRVVQCAAYLITGDGTHDLSTLTPIFDIPQPPGPPPINAELEIVAQTNPATFHADAYLAFKLTLTKNYASSTIAGGKAGNLYTFCIVQDGAGNHTMPWPANTLNMPDLCMAPNSLTTAVCLCDDLNRFICTGATVYDPAA